MVNEEKFLIGIDDSNRDSVVGSLIIVMVITKPDFFRKFSFLKLKDSKKLNKREIQKIVEGTQKYITDFSIDYMKPKDITKENFNDLEMKSVIDVLNQRLKFWKNNLFINNFDKSKEEFIGRFIRLAPENLKIDKLNIDKWTITHDPDNYKICLLASCYAKYYSNIDIDDIKSVWGDFGSGELSDPKTIQFLKEHPDCPHIRKLALGGKNGEKTT